MLSCTVKSWAHLIRLQIYFHAHHWFFIQIEGLQFVRDQLCFSGLSSEVQPLPSQRAGPELQQAECFRSENAVWFSAAFTLQTGDSEVRHSFLILCSDYFDMKVVLTLNCRHKVDITLIPTEYLNVKVWYLLLWFSPLTVAEQCWAAHLKLSSFICHLDMFNIFWNFVILF